MSWSMNRGGHLSEDLCLTS